MNSDKDFIKYFEKFTDDSCTMIKNAVMIPATVIDGHVYLLTTLELRLNGEHEWGFPGGKIDRGETKYDACFREFFEETNLSIDSNDIDIITMFCRRKTFFMVVWLLVDIPSFIANNEILALCWIPWHTFIDALYNTQTITCDEHTYGLRRAMKTLKY